MNAKGPALNPLDLEGLWRGRLADAKAKYVTAVERFHTASEELRTRAMPSSDGCFSVHLAIAAESSARKQYMRTLRAFTELVLYGKIPDEEEPHDKPWTGPPSSQFPRKTG